MRYHGKNFVEDDLKNLQLCLERIFNVIFSKRCKKSGADEITSTEMIDHHHRKEKYINWSLKIEKHKAVTTF